MSSISQDDLARLKDLLARLTPGPWVSYVEGRDHWGGSNVITTGGDDIEPHGASEADQDFMAAARQDMPRLIAEIERLQALLNGKQDAID